MHYTSQYTVFIVCHLRRFNNHTAVKTRRILNHLAFHMCARVYVRACVRVCACLCSRACVYMCVRARVCLRLRVCVCVHACLCLLGK